MSNISRRKILAGAIAGAIAATAGTALYENSGRAPKSSKRVVISGWGGSMQRAMRDAYFTPFTRETGIEVVEQTYGSQGLARVKAQLGEGGAQVDLLDGAPFWPVVGRKQGLLEKITLPDVDESLFLPGAIDEYAFGYTTVSWGITYIRQGRPAPGNWREFWNTRDFPGRRAFFGPFVARHAEYALMADGVRPEDVYPLTDAKLERAFAKLAQIEPSVDIWYQTAAQCEQLLVGEQVDMAEFFSGRVFILQDQGVPVEFVWNEAITNMPVFVLAKGAPNRANALEFLAYLTRPEPQAALAKLIYYGPTNTSAFDLINDQKTLERLPTYGANLSRQIILDGNWWGENLHRFAPRWSQLIHG
jgi:putative spermidine/putrescine transport system substrate-binding protein